jgi:hypothetical protein
MDRTRHVEVDARAELGTRDEMVEGDEEKEEVEDYNIDIDWAPVRAVPATTHQSKEADAVAAAEAPAPPRWVSAPPRWVPAPRRWVPWARGAYDPAVHGCASGICKKNRV